MSTLGLCGVGYVGLCGVKSKHLTMLQRKEMASRMKKLQQICNKEGKMSVWLVCVGRE